MKYLLLLLLPLSIYASKILSYNIYDRSDRADVMITFDTPYSGTIKQSKGKNRTIIKLEDATIESTKVKKVNSKYLHSLTITPLQGQTQITAYTPDNVHFIASKTADAYGLRLRFTNKSAQNMTHTSAASGTTTDLSALPTKRGDEMSRSYYVVVAILIIGIIILFILKKKITDATQAAPRKKQTSWLFNAPQEQKKPQETNAPQADAQNKSLSIRFQKALDQNNSVVMLDFGEYSYLVIVGNGNLLLEKFQENAPKTEEEFSSILQEHNQQLETFLGSSQSKTFPGQTQTAHKEPLDAYKERAASLAYGE